MKKALSFKDNLKWTIIGQGSDVLTQFGIIMIISRLANVEIVGLYGIISALVSPLQQFLMLDMSRLLVTSKDFDENFPIFHTVNVLTLLFVPVLSVLICYIIYRDPSLLLCTLAFALYRMMINYREFCYAIYQRYERLDYMGKSMFVISLLSLISFLTSYYFFRNLAISFFILFTVLAITLILQELRYLRIYLGKGIKLFAFDSKKIINLLKQGIPLGATAFVTSFKSNIPRYFIEFGLQDRSIVGFYTAFMQMTNALGYMNQALAKTMIGRYTNLFRTNYNQFLTYLKKSILGVFAVGVVAIALTYLLGPFVSRIMYGKEYGEHNYILMYLIVARFFVMPTTQLKIVQIILRQINIQLTIMLLSVFTLIALCFVLSKVFGLNGILISLVISELFVFIITGIYVTKKLSNEQKI